MPDQKLSALSAGAAVAATDLFYSAQDVGAGAFSQVKQPASAVRTFMGSRPQRYITAAGAVTPAATDQLITFNVTAGAAPTYALPTIAARNAAMSGVPITFKDVGGQFATRNLTITPNGAETIEGLATLVLSNNYAGVTLYPRTDGVAQWFVL